MFNSERAIVASCLVAAAVLIISVTACIFSTGGWDTDAETDSIAWPTPTGSIGTAARAFRCQEDEDIVVTLGNNGLPYAFCEQVIER